MTAAESAAPPPDASPDEVPPAESALAVFRNAAFLRLWLSQAATQIGGNMVLFGLTVIIVESTGSNTAVSLMILSFLVPAVLFSAVAGVYVDRIDRRTILVATNILRGLAYIALYLVGANLALILLLNVFVSTVTVFFAPAEAAMIPEVVERHQLLAANGIFTLTLNGAFAIGFALLGPLVVNLASPEAVILVVAFLYLLAAVFCFTLPKSPPNADAHGLGVSDAEHAVGSTLGQLREGLAFIRSNRSIGWSILYLGITASLIGVIGVLGPDLAKKTLGLGAKDFAVVVLPLGFGVVLGIMLLNAYGRYLPRRRVIEGGLISLGLLLALLSVAGSISHLLQRADAPGGLDLSGVTSLLSVVVVIALLAGIAYAAVAIPSQTQLSEDLPEDVRGRVFGVLGMLVSVASFVPIIVVGTVSDAVGTTNVLIAVAIAIFAAGAASVIWRVPSVGSDGPAADPHIVDPIASALGADRPTWHDPEMPTQRVATPVATPVVAPFTPPAADPVTSVPVDVPGPADPADRD